MELTKDFLYDQYITKNKTAIQIGKEYGYNRGVVAYALSRYGIKRNPQRVTIHTRTPQEKKKNIEKLTYEYLYTEHIINRKPMFQIAAEANVNTNTVKRYMIKNDIDYWTCRDNTNQYIDNHDGSTTVKVFDRYGIYKNSFIIDTDKTEKIKHIKWIIVEDNIKKERPQYRVVTGSHPSIVLGRYLLDLNDTYFVDHKDNNPLNNRVANLRVVTRSQNQQNHDIQSNNKTGICGVCWNQSKKKWHAQMGFHGLKLKFGFYDLFEDAVYARYVAERLLFKEYRSNRNDDVISEYIQKCNNKTKIKEYIMKRIKMKMGENYDCQTID